MTRHPYTPESLCRLERRSSAIAVTLAVLSVLALPLVLAILLSGCGAHLAHDAGWLAWCPVRAQMYVPVDSCGAPPWLARDRQLIVSVADAELLEPVRDVLDDYESALGLDLFAAPALAPASDADDIAIRHVAHEPGEPRGICTTRPVRKPSGELRAVIRIANWVERSTLERVLHHEVGHALGLAHDERTDSWLAEHPREDGWLRLTDEDAERLRSVYGVHGDKP